MACEQWRSRLDAYADGELDSQQASALAAHLPGCSACAGDVSGPSAIETIFTGRRKAICSQPRVTQSNHETCGREPRRESGWYWKILAAPAAAVLIFSLAVNLYVGRENARRQRVYSELADLHVSALASATPVDVLSTDRHTVKPWFQGKIPFTFSLPELQGSDFTLLGGKVTYLAQTPGAHLIYRLRKHQISVFIFQDRGKETNLPSGAVHAASFNTENWTQKWIAIFRSGRCQRRGRSAAEQIVAGRRVERQA